MAHEQQHYVNGEWVAPLQPVLLDVVDPSTEEAFTRIAVGGPKDVDRAVAAARAAFPSFARTSRKDRLDLLRAILSDTTNGGRTSRSACRVKWARPWRSRCARSRAPAPRI